MKPSAPLASGEAANMAPMSPAAAAPSAVPTSAALQTIAWLERGWNVWKIAIATIAMSRSASIRTFRLPRFTGTTFLDDMGRRETPTGASRRRGEKRVPAAPAGSYAAKRPTSPTRTSTIASSEDTGMNSFTPWQQ